MNGNRLPDYIDLIWKEINQPLIVFLVTFSLHDGQRHFPCLYATSKLCLATRSLDQDRMLKNR